MKPYMWNCSNSSQHYLGDKVFCDVLVGEVRGLDQLAGERGVGLVNGLPIDPWWRGEKIYSSRTSAALLTYYCIYFLVPRNI